MMNEICLQILERGKWVEYRWNENSRFWSLLKPDNGEMDVHYTNTFNIFRDKV